MISSASLVFAVLGQTLGTAPPLPSSVTIARHSYFDFGPPFDHYDLTSVRATESGVEIERFRLEPEGIQCLAPPTMESGRVEIARPLIDILGNQNPCSMPLKELQRKQKKPKGLHFTGASIALQLQCGAETRTFQISMWDSDLFEPDSKIAPRTAWIRGVFKTIEKDGPEFEEHCVFELPKVRIAPNTIKSPMEEMLSQRRFDALLPRAPYALSAIYADSQRPWPTPTSSLNSASSLLPHGDVPIYPDIARLARLQGRVQISARVLPDGTMSEPQVTGPPLLVGAVKARMSKWTFDAATADRIFEGAIEYNLGCPVK